MDFFGVAVIFKKPLIGAGCLLLGTPLPSVHANFYPCMGPFHSMTKPSAVLLGLALLHRHPPVSEKHWCGKSEGGPNMMA
jgi:hypothetical protein